MESHIFGYIPISSEAVLNLNRILILMVVGLPALFVHGQDNDQTKKRITVKAGLLVVLRDTVFITRSDTVIFLDPEDAKRVKVKENPYKKSSAFYDSLAKKSNRSKLAGEIFDFVVRQKSGGEKQVSQLQKSEEIFEPYEGYTIGTIVFKQVDLLEGSVIDTVREATTKIGKFVNNIHVDTRKAILRQNLLFKKGDKVDPYLLADNERLLRQFKTLRDARIYLQPREHESIVDVVVVTQDVTSLGASGGYSSFSNFRLDVYDINILGYAKQFQVSYFRNSTEAPNNGFELTLREQNLYKTFIQGEIQHTNNYLRERTRVSFSRDFFTPEIKYAGGAEFYRTSEKFYFEDYDTLELPYTENNTDLWLGRSIKIQRRTNLIFSARMNNRNFIERPFVASDSNSFFFDRSLLLSHISLTKRNFLKNNRINGFGKTEDVPVGASVGLLLGKELNEFKDREYFEINGALRKYTSELGYFNISATAGSYFKSGKAEDGVIKLGGLYFSDLVKVRRMRMRQFVYVNYIKGINRVLDKSVSLDGKWKSDNMRPYGIEKLSFGLENVYFMPWYVYGFQFALYHRFDLNFLSNEQPLLSRDSVFPVARVGMRTLNENLVFPTFSLEVGYYVQNKNYPAAWEISFSTTLPNLFGTSQLFKPRVTPFE